MSLCEKAHSSDKQKAACRLIQRSQVSKSKQFKTPSEYSIHPPTARIRYTDREHYENIGTVSMEWKQACPQLHSRQAHHPNALMNAIGQSQHASMALLISTTLHFLLTCPNKDGRYPTTYKRNSKNTSSVADWSMDFYAYNAVPATMNSWLRSAVRDVVSVPVAVPGEWPRVLPCW